MTLAGFFEGMTEVRAALTGDRQGRLLEATESVGDDAEQEAAAAAMAASALDAAAEALGLGALAGLQVRSSTRATLTAVSPTALLLVSVDPVRRTAEVEKRLAAWGTEAAPADPPGRSDPPGHADLPVHADLPAFAPSAVAAADLPPAGTGTAIPAAGPREDAWAALRRALVRAHLSEAVVRLREVAAASAAGAAPAGPGAEPLAPEALGAAMQRLLEGIGSVMAGDTL